MVTVLMATYRGKQYLEQQLDTILAQTVPVRILISDDGVGISPEKLQTILSGTGQSSSGGTNIAIYNTHRRLQILYGQKYGLSYTSIPGQGTEVQIRIPAKKES